MSILFRLFVIAFVSALAVPSHAEISFQDAVENNIMGLDFLPAPAVKAVLAEAESMAEYRRVPQSASGEIFTENCLSPASASSVFCRTYFEKSKPAARLLTKPMPYPARLKFFHTLLQLNGPQPLVKSCPRVVSDLTKLARNPQVSRLRARSLYWLWTCAKAMKQERHANEIKETMWRESPFDHHTFLVLRADDDSRIEKVFAGSTELPVQLRSNISPDGNAWITAIEALLRLHEDGAAAVVAKRFLSEGFDKLEPRVQLYVASLADRISRMVPSLLPVTRVLVPMIGADSTLLTRATASALFPLDYEVVDPKSKQAVRIVDLIQHDHGEIDRTVLTGLMHYESAFNPRARSGVGAIGLLQILPDTADSYCHSVTGGKTVSRDDLYDPSVNIQIGARVLADYQHRLKGSLPLALAAYNAGVRGVNDWLKSVPDIRDPQLQADLLFVNEKYDSHISDYVSSVLGKADWYGVRYDQQNHIGFFQVAICNPEIDLGSNAKSVKSCRH